MPQNDTSPAGAVLSITDADATHPECRAVFIGVSQDIDIYAKSPVDGSFSWVLFKGLVAGTIIPVYATGVRKNAGSAAPDAGDIIFLY
jgi:hypothetical protein